MTDGNLFSTLIFSLSRLCLMDMGYMSEELHEVNFKSAQNNIDILNMLKDKTQNNLTEEEDKLLQSIIYDLQLKYVEKTKQQSS
jgi:hypothetical protein